MINPVVIMMFLGAMLFCCGLIIVITKRNAIMMLIGVELLFNASNINLIAFNRIYPAQVHGQIFSLFVILVAVCETAIGLAIILRTYQFYKTSVPDEISELKG